jgi:hypothetical protein
VLLRHPSGASEPHVGLRYWAHRDTPGAAPERPKGADMTRAHPSLLLVLLLIALVLLALLGAGWTWEGGSHPLT